MEINFENETYKLLLTKLHENHLKEVRKFSQNPKELPNYTKEWMKFLLTRYKKIQAVGGDTFTYNYQAEFDKYWPKRFEELMRVRWLTKKVLSEKCWKKRRKNTTINYMIANILKALEKHLRSYSSSDSESECNLSNLVSETSRDYAKTRQKPFLNNYPVVNDRNVESNISTATESVFSNVRAKRSRSKSASESSFRENVKRTNICKGAQIYLSSNSFSLSPSSSSSNSDGLKNFEKTKAKSKSAQSHSSSSCSRSSSVSRHSHLSDTVSRSRCKCRSEPKHKKVSRYSRNNYSPNMKCRKCSCKNYKHRRKSSRNYSVSSSDSSRSPCTLASRRRRSNTGSCSYTSRSKSKSLSRHRSSRSRSKSSVKIHSSREKSAFSSRKYSHRSRVESCSRNDPSSNRSRSSSRNKSPRSRPRFRTESKMHSLVSNRNLKSMSRSFSRESSLGSRVGTRDHHSKSRSRSLSQSPIFSGLNSANHKKKSVSKELLYCVESRSGSETFERNIRESKANELATSKTNLDLLHCVEKKLVEKDLTFPSNPVNKSDCVHSNAVPFSKLENEMPQTACDGSTCDSKSIKETENESKAKTLINLEHQFFLPEECLKLDKGETSDIGLCSPVLKEGREFKADVQDIIETQSYAVNDKDSFKIKKPVIMNERSSQKNHEIEILKTPSQILINILLQLNPIKEELGILSPIVDSILSSLKENVILGKDLPLTLDQKLAVALIQDKLRINYCSKTPENQTTSFDMRIVDEIQKFIESDSESDVESHFPKELFGLDVKNLAASTIDMSAAEIKTFIRCTMKYEGLSNFNSNHIDYIYNTVLNVQENMKVLRKDYTYS